MGTRLQEAGCTHSAAVMLELAKTTTHQRLLTFFGQTQWQWEVSSGGDIEGMGGPVGFETGGAYEEKFGARVIIAEYYSIQIRIPRAALLGKQRNTAVDYILERTLV